MAMHAIMKRKSHALIIVLILVEVACFLIVQSAPGFASQDSNGPATIKNICDPDDAAAFWAKVTALVEMGRKARETGEAYQFNQTFNEDEINSAIDKLVADYRDRSVAPKDIRVYLRDESVYGIAIVDMLGLQISVSAAPEIWLEGGKPRAKLKSIDVQGAPGFLNNIILGLVNQRIDAEYGRIIRSRKYDNLQITSITLGDRKVTIAGIAR